MRRPSPGGGIADRGAELIQGDLHCAATLERLVEDSAAVIHSAGVVRGGSRHAFDAVNVDGTAAVIEAVKRRHNPPRLVLISSLAAREPQLSWYAGSKRAAEQLLEREDTLDWVIIRPPPVYGPGDREMLPVFRLMARGLAPVPGTPDARLSLVHVDDLVAALAACLDSGAVAHRTLALCDGRLGGYDWRELAAVVESVTRQRVRIWPVPAPLLDSVARFNLLLGNVTGRAPMLTPAKLRELRHPDWVVDNEAITAATGWQPRVDLRQGLAELLSPG